MPLLQVAILEQVCKVGDVGGKPQSGKTQVGTENTFHMQGFGEEANLILNKAGTKINHCMQTDP